MDNPYKPVAITDSDHEHLVTRGRLIVLCVIGFVVTLSLLTILLSIAALGPKKLPAQIVRFLLTLGLVFCLYRGQSWARYVMVFLFGLASIMGMLAIPSIMARAHPAMTAYMVVMTVGYAASAISLVAFPSVSRFMAYQRGRP